MKKKERKKYNEKEQKGSHSSHQLYDIVIPTRTYADIDLKSTETWKVTVERSHQLSDIARRTTTLVPR